MPGLSNEDTDPSLGSEANQLSQPQPASAPTAHQSFHPASAAISSPAAGPSSGHQLLPDATPIITPPEPQAQPFPDLPSALRIGSAFTGPHAQSGYPQPALSLSDTHIADHAAAVHCTSPISQQQSGQLPSAALHRVTSGSTVGSPPTHQRMRAAKTIAVENKRPLASVEAVDLVSESPSPVHSFPMMMVAPARSHSSPAAKRPKTRPSPLDDLDSTAFGRSSAPKPIGAQWPAAADALLQHAQPPVVSPGRPAAHVPAFQIPNVLQGVQHALVPTNLEALSDANIPVGSTPNPFEYRSYVMKTGLGQADTEADAANLIRQSGHAAGLTDDQFQSLPLKASELFATRSTHSMQAAEETGALYADQMLQQGRHAHMAAPAPDSNAIDLRDDDDALLDPAGYVDQQAQIARHERMAKDLERSEINGQAKRLTVSCHKP